MKTLAVAGAGALVVGLHQSVKAALEAEASQSRLQQAFKNSHLSMKTYERSLGSTEKASRRLGFGDNDVRESLGSLLTATDSYKKSLSLLSTAQNISRFKHVGLVDATKMLTMAMTGSQRATKQLGLTISPVTTNVDKLKAAHEALSKEQQKATAETYKEQLAHAKLQDKLATGNAVIAAVTQKTKGFSEAYGKTAAGSIDRFRAEFDHLKAELGKGLLPILTAGTSKLTSFVSSFEAHLPQIRAQFGGLADVVGSAGKALLGFGASTAGQSAIAGLATTFVGSGLVGEVHNFVDLLKTANPEMIGLGIVAGVLGGAFYYLATSTDEMTASTNSAIAAIRTLKAAQDASAQSARNRVVAHHQVTATANEVTVAEKAYTEAVRRSGKGSDEAKQALDRLHAAQDAHAQSVANATDADRKDAAQHRATAHAIEEKRKKVNELAQSLKRAEEQNKASLIAAGQSIQGNRRLLASMNAADVDRYAAGVARLARALGGGATQAGRFAIVTGQLAQALDRLPTRKEVNIFIHTFRLGETRAQTRGRPRGGNAAGGVVAGPPSSLLGPDTILGALIPGEIVVNPARPDRGLEALRAAGIEGFARGGKVKRHRAPRLPKWIDLAETRARGTATLTDDIAALREDERWTNQQLGRGDLTASERRTLQKRRITNKQKMTRLRTRQSTARQKDYSQLPASIRLRIARARNEHDNVKLLAALRAGESWLKQQLNRKHLTKEQKISILDALTSIEDEIASVQGELQGSGDATADQQASFDQRLARSAAARLSGELDNAFVQTGVFAGAGGGTGGTHITLQSLVPPDPEWIRKLAAYTTLGLGWQGHRHAQRHRLGV